MKCPTCGANSLNPAPALCCGHTIDAHTRSGCRECTCTVARANAAQKRRQHDAALRNDTLPWHLRR